MQQVDERLLEHLADDSCASYRYLAGLEEITASRLTVLERCRVLSRVGLVAPLTNDELVWELTEKGDRYLDGKLNQEVLPDPWADGEETIAWWLTPS